MSFPTISQEIMRELETKFPDKMPDPNDDIRTIRLKQGEQRVMNFLRATYKQQQDRIPNVCIRQ